MNKMIFVMGCAHGGTTLVATILGAHRKCYVIPSETCAYTKDRWTNKGDLIRAMSDIKSEYIIEKTPRHVFNLKQMKEDFPDASFIVMIRNPLDVTASIYAREGNFNKALYECLNDLTGCLSVMNDDRVMLVEYESIVDNFENTMTMVCQHIGIEFEPQMKDFHEYSPDWFSEHVAWDDHLSRRAWQMKQPLFDGRGRWQKELNAHQIYQIMGDCNNKYINLLENLLIRSSNYDKIS